MRSTRASAALARLNRRSPGEPYRMTLTSQGLIRLREHREGVDRDVSPPLSLDDFVALVDSLGPQKEVRISKSEAAFMKQLKKKDDPA